MQYIWSIALMNNRKFKTDPKELLRQGQEIMSSSDESKYYFRVFSVNMVLSGMTVEKVAQSANVTSVSVSNWVKNADENGFESLKNKEKTGRPNKLSEEQLTEINTILQEDPNTHGFKVWDGPSLSALIMNKYDVDYSVRNSQRLFHKLGFSHIRPRCFPSKGFEDTEQRQAFKKNTKQ